MIAAILIVLATGFASFGLTALAIRVLSARAVLDRPNERSSHTRPVPRGAGLAIMAALAPALLAIGLVAGDLATVGPVLAGLFLLTAVSFLDDVGDLDPLWRLMAQAAAVGLGLIALPEGTVTQGLLPLWLDRILVMVGWLWFINLYNFMDGIDGITAVQTITIGLGVALVAAFNLSSGALVPMGFVAAAAALGFLPWNWHRARIFLGDVGSVPLGFLLGFLLVSLARDGLWAAALTLPLYYLVDATLTLVRRAMRGERVWQAHREHLYQRAAAVAGHATVSLLLARINLVLVAVAVLTVLSPWPLVLAVLAVAWLMRRLEALADGGDGTAPAEVIDEAAAGPAAGA